MSSRSPGLVESVQNVALDVPKLISSGIKDHNDREKYYLAQEAWIRQRVNLLDETQAIIAQERDLLKLQHDHCREQIIKTRKGVDDYKERELEFIKLCSVSPSLQKKEELLDRELNEVSAALDGIEQSLAEAATNKSDIQRRHSALREEERKNGDLVLDLLEDVERLKDKKQTLLSDIKKLERHREALSEWSDRLDATETRLASRKNELYKRHEIEGKDLTHENLLTMPLHLLFGSPVNIDREIISEEIDYN